MKTPEYLKKGDVVAVVSTARKISEKELQPSLDFIKKWGLQIVLGETIGAEEDQFAGSDDFRAADVQKMLDNPTIKAIWCAKGGYGTVRIIDKLDFSHFVNAPKWILGYSDVTVLHSHIHNLGIETLHGQTLLGLETKSQETAESIHNVLFGRAYSISLQASSHKRIRDSTSMGNLSQTSNRTGCARGQIVGGNLSILYSLCGSKSTLNTEGKILFIEDLDEYLYHIDRMMMNLKRNGMLENLAGLIVGGMTEMNDNIIPFGKTAEETVWEAVKGFDYPVYFNFPAGHIPDNRALILGREVNLEIIESYLKLQF